MIRTLLATTALAALLTTGVIAQDAAPAPAPTPMENAVDNAADAVKDATDAAAGAVKDAAAATKDAAADAADKATDAAHNAAMAVDNATRPEFNLSVGYTAVDTDNLGTRLIGQSVYSTTGTDAEDIGKITDIVFDNNGQIVAAIIGVGGFLGLGEKSVAVDFRTLEFTIAADNTERWVLPTTAEALNAAPDFVWVEDEPAAVDAVPPAVDTMAPAPATN